MPSHSATGYILEMDKQAVIDELKTATELAWKRIVDTPRPDRHSSDYWTGRAAVEVSGQLEELLARQPEFSGNARMIQSGDWGAARFHADTVASRLIGQVLQGGSAEQVVESLDRILSADSADGLLIMLLWGVTVSQPKVLGGGIELIPESDLPTSRILQAIRDDANNFSFRPLSPFHHHIEPQAALIQRVTVSPLFVDPGATLEQRSGHPWIQLDEVRNAMTAAGPCAPVAAACWFQFIDNDLNAYAAGGVTSFQHDIAMRPFEVLVDLDRLPVQKIVSAIRSLKGHSSSKVSIALERLAQSLRRRGNGDKAIELAIAFEALLVNDRGDNRYKVAVHSGMLTTGPMAIKLDARRVAKKLYDLRSEVVHGGRVKNEAVAMGTISEATALLTQLIQIIAKRGEIPDWESFELNPPQPDPPPSG